MKHILESSTAVIDQIFQKRTKRVEAAKKEEEDKKAAEDAEYKEVMDANQSLKESLQGKSQPSKNTLKQLSGDPTMKTITTGADDKSSTGKPVDTAKEFLSTINDQLHTAGAGIQIIMEESKNARWFNQKQKDQQRINKQYAHVRKWEVAPKTFAETQLDAKTLNAAKAAAKMKGKNGVNSATD